MAKQYRTNRKTKNRFVVGTQKQTEKPRVVRIKVIREVDEQPDLSYIGEFSNTPGPFAIPHRQRSGDRNVYEYFNPANATSQQEAEQAYSNIMNYENGNFVDYFIYAEAIVMVPGGTTQRIRSGGIGGIQSNSDASYMNEIENEQIDELMSQLKVFGLHSNLDAPIERDYE